MPARVHLTLDWRGDAVVANVLQAAETATKESLDLAVEAARGSAPVASGAYRDSIQATEPRREGDDIRGGFGAGVPYAIFVEIGARGQPGRHVLRHAADRAFPGHAGRIKANL